MVTVPRLGRSSVARILSSVVLPAPLAPSSATASPPRTSSVTPSSTAANPKTLRTPTTRIRGSGLMAASAPASTHVAGVTERVPAGLEPHGQAMRLMPDGDRLHDFARGRIDDVHDAIVP